MMVTLPEPLRGGNAVHTPRATLTMLAMMAATLGVALPPALARSAAVDAERSDADRRRIEAAEAKRARRAVKRIAAMHTKGTAK